MGRELGRELEELGCRALLILSAAPYDPDLAYFVGAARLREAVLVQGPSGPPRLAPLSPMERLEAAGSGLEVLDAEALDLVRWSREARDEGSFLAAVALRALQLADVAPGPVALAGSGRAGSLQTVVSELGRVGWPPRSGRELMLRLRRPKTRGEVDEIRRVATAVEACLRRVAAILAGSRERRGELEWGGEPLRVGTLRREVAVRFAAEGLEQPDGNILAPGGQGAVPHTVGDDDRVLKTGESLVVDLFPRGGQFADCTRTFCVGTPPEALARAHHAVREALEAVRADARAGVVGWSLQERACEILSRAGYPTPISSPGTTRGYVHNLGHGVGLELHELPSFRRDAAQGRLAPGDVFTLEPGVYEPGAGFAVRLEDLFTVGGDGAVEPLIRLPYELDPVLWGPG